MSRKQLAMREIQIVFTGDPHIALLDPLNEHLGIEFPETCGNLEQLRGHPDCPCGV